MTRKDYIKIADVLIMNADVYENEYFMSALCDQLESDNPNFDRDRFCDYIEEGIQKDIESNKEYIETLNMIL